jgi:hypothetical protein
MVALLVDAVVPFADDRLNTKDKSPVMSRPVWLASLINRRSELAASKSPQVSMIPVAEEGPFPPPKVRSFPFDVLESVPPAEVSFQ